MNKLFLSFLIITGSLITNAVEPGGSDIPLINYKTEFSSAPLTPPRIGTTTQPGCALATGSVELTGLPKSGSWILTRTPGGIKTTGSGTSTTVTGLVPGTYSFTVTNSSGSISDASANVIIHAQPVIPSLPLQSVDCSPGSGK